MHLLRHRNPSSGFPVFPLDQRSACRGVKIAQRAIACSRGLNKTLGNVFAGFVVAAVMRQFTADIFKHDVHVCLGAFVEFTHFASLPRVNDPMHFAFLFVVQRTLACKVEL
jgi:hypothetical protein